MKDETKLDKINKWFLNKWWIAIIIFVVGLVLFLPKLFDAIKSIKKETNNIERVINNYPEDWNKAYSCFEIGYSKIMIVNYLNNPTELVKWQNHIQINCSAIGLQTKEVIDINNFDELAYKISSYLKSRGEDKYLRYFELPYYYPWLIDDILNNGKFEITPEIDEVMSKISLPKKAKDEYQIVKARIEHHSKGEEMIALNEFLDFLNNVRDIIDKSR